jgi:hypothetical protein
VREISTHLSAFTSTLSAVEEKAFAEYWQNYRAKRKAGDPFSLPPLERPYWMLLPDWLLRRNPEKRESLEDILVAQYYLFLAFRIHDDLLDDGSRHPQALKSIPAALFIEAKNMFSRLFPPSSIFWSRYGESISETTDAIANADILQNSPTTSPERLLDEYARINSVFLVGSWAACVLTGRFEDFECVKSFADDLSRGAQVLDDYYDMKEDLMRGKYNYVANMLMRSTHQTASQVPSMERRFIEESLDKILLFIEQCYQTAYEKLETLEITESSQFAEEYIKRIEMIREDQPHFF